MSDKSKQASALDDFELEDMARSALQEGLSFGVNLDVFMRFAKRIASAALSQQPAPAAVPDGWRQVIDEVRERMNNDTPSAYDNEGYRSYAGHILDCVIDELDALSCTPAAPAPEAQKPAAWEVSSFGGRVDRIVVREDVAQELASNLIQRDAKDVRVRPLYTAPPAAEHPDWIELGSGPAYVGWMTGEEKERMKATEQTDTVPVPRELQADDRVPDDFRNQASGYRAGWNDCLAALLARRAYEPA